MSDQDTAPETKAEAPAKAAPKRKAPLKKAPAKKPDTAKAPAPKKPAPKAASGQKEPAKKPDTTQKDGDPSASVVGGNAKAQLQALKESILLLEEEKAEIAAEIKEKYAEAKSMGFDSKILRKVIAASKRDPKEVEEERALFDLYADAAGIYAKLES